MLALTVGVAVAGVGVGVVVVSHRRPRAGELLGKGAIGDERYGAIFAAQRGVCAICGNPPKTRRLDVDHDHKTGRVRGLLCHRCNRALPSWVTRAWLWQAVLYLDDEPLDAGALNLYGRESP